MNSRIVAWLFLITASVTPTAAATEEKRLDGCNNDDLAVLYAESYSAAWINPLTDAMVSVEIHNIKNHGNLSVSNEEINRLKNNYRKIVEKYYSFKAWLPGAKNFINEHLTPSEQCQLLAFYKTEIGAKALLMQTTPGGSEFIRQQATNFRREQKKFYAERVEVLRAVFPTIPDSYFSTPSPF
jgi:hypothetical protein